MQKLYMVKIGATPKGRLIEQHDVFFGVAEDVKALIPAIDKHWQEVAGQWHFDAYRPVTVVDNHKIDWVEDNDVQNEDDLKLYFINLGGYLPNHFEEYHHKLLVVAKTQPEAIKRAKQSDFYKQYSCLEEGSKAVATSHIDDKMQVDVDDIYDVNGLLGKGKLVIAPLSNDENITEDKSVIGYISLKSINK